MIDWTTVSAELRTQLAARLPTGLTLENNVRFASARVVALEPVPLLDSELRLAAEMERAGGPPMVTNGKPTITRIVAWLAHEGINKNRLAFVKADLEQAAAKIKEPDFLPMDFNHSAMDGYGWQQKAIGVWYRAELAQDPEANNAWGIIATGMMWSWLNPDLADRLLAEQARNGRMDFSMACICGTVAQKRNEDGPYEEAADTTFFTLSALDVPPADPAATGKGVEGSEDPNLETQLREELVGKVEQQQLARIAAFKRGQMDELIQQLKTLSAKATEIVEGNGTMAEQVADAVNAKVAELLAVQAQGAPPKKADADPYKTVETDDVVVDGDIALNEENKVLAAKVAELEGQLADLATAKDALATQVTTANAEIERLSGELATAQSALATYQAAEQSAAAAAKLTARIDELPDAYRAAFTARPADEQEKARARWAAMSDDQWSAFKTDIGVMPVARLSYLDRSANEKLLPNTPSAGSTKERLAQFLSK